MDARKWMFVMDENVEIKCIALFFYKYINIKCKHSIILNV